MEITNVSQQVVATNQNVLFSETPICGNCGIIHREGSGIVTLRGVGSQKRARYKVFFGGNVAINTGEAAGPIQLSIAINGEAVNSSQMIITPAAAVEYFNVQEEIFIDVPICCCVTISVKNTSTLDILVQNANLIVERVA